MTKSKVRCYYTKCSHNPSGVDLVNNIQRGYRLVKVETRSVHQQKETETQHQRIAEHGEGSHVMEDAIQVEEEFDNKEDEASIVLETDVL
jgi:hypothetical protein